jgi:hypothetical protein
MVISKIILSFKNPQKPIASRNAMRTLFLNYNLQLKNYTMAILFLHLLIS